MEVLVVVLPMTLLHLYLLPHQMELEMVTLHQHHHHKEIQVVVDFKLLPQQDFMLVEVVEQVLLELQEIQQMVVQVV
jgi:hypothetical protein